MNPTDGRADTMSLGTPELIIIAAIALLLFGASLIPRLAHSVSSAREEFESARQPEPRA
jgi:TatA/E family protein of Tat protein translocase